MIRLPFAWVLVFACALASGPVRAADEAATRDLAFTDPDGHLVVLYELD